MSTTAETLDREAYRNGAAFAQAYARSYGLDAARRAMFKLAGRETADYLRGMRASVRGMETAKQGRAAA